MQRWVLAVTFPLVADTESSYAFRVRRATRA